MPFHQGHALLVGVGSHQYHGEADVPVSVRDAEAVAAVLQDPNACGYLPEQVQLLHDSTATKHGILTALEQLAETATPESTVFFFYCGHGTLGTKGNYYLVSHDARIQGNRVVEGTGVSESELLEKLRAVKARRLLVILNACYSGNISPSLTLQPATLQPVNPSEETTMALLGTGSGRIVITACREHQVSYIGGGRLSLFTQALVDGLRGKGVHNQHGLISAFGLYEYLYAQVRERVEKQIQTAIQEPELTVIKGVGPFAVALYKGAKSFGELNPEPLPQGYAVREVAPEQSIQHFNQRMVQTGGGAYVEQNVHIEQGDHTIGEKITYSDKIRGDRVQGNKIGGDNISVGNISGSQGIAIGRNASASVNDPSLYSLAKIDPQQLRAALELLWEELGAAQLPREQKRIAQTAASNAIDGIGDKETESATIIGNVQKIGETLKQINTTVEEGSSLWRSIQNLAYLIGPMVGGVRVVAGWFGLPL